MPTVIWARVDPARRTAIIEAAEAEFGAHGFSGGSLNVIARNVALLRKQIDVLAEMLASATPDTLQQKDIDLAFGVGQLFATVPYAQLILEEALLSGCDEALLDEIFAVLVRDFNSYAVELGDKSATTDAQARFAMRMIRRPVFDAARYDKVWKEHVQPINGAYQMRP